MKDYKAILQSNPLFFNIAPEDYEEVLSFLNAYNKTFQKNEVIYSQNIDRRMSGILLDGMAELHYCDENFNQINLIRLKNGDIFGAAMVLSGQQASPMELTALNDCSVLFLDFDRLVCEESGLSSPAIQKFTKNLLQEFARRMQFLSVRVRILSQRRLRDKLKVYFQNQHIEPDGSIRLPMNRSRMADFLYVDRSALSRELSRMQDEGILELNGKEIRLLQKSFLS